MYFNQTLCLCFFYEVKVTHTSGLPRVREMSGKNEIFLQVREKSGNFEKMSGNFGHLTNVRELSGNFVMTIFFQIELMLG